MFGFLDRLFNSGCIIPILEDLNSTFAASIFNLTQSEICENKGNLRISNVSKLVESISVLCQLIQVQNEICSKALGRLTILLCNRQKYIRKTTSTKLYEALLVYGDGGILPGDTIDEAMQILSDTDWEGNVENLRPIRNNLCTLLGIKPPTLICRPTSSK